MFRNQTTDVETVGWDIASNYFDVGVIYYVGQFCQTVDLCHILMDCSLLIYCHWHND